MNITSQLIKELQNKLKKDLKDKYMGLWSVAVCLVNTYFHYHNNPEEYMYFANYKAFVLGFELMIWLSENRINRQNKNFNFEKILKQAEESLKYIKIKLYNRWINNDLKKLLEQAKLKQLSNPNDIKLLYYVEMLEDLLEKYPKPNGKDNWNFKESIEL